MKDEPLVKEDKVNSNFLIERRVKRMFTAICKQEGRIESRVVEELIKDWLQERIDIKGLVAGTDGGDV
jgi:hypothetical protein